MTKKMFFRCIVPFVALLVFMPSIATAVDSTVTVNAEIKTGALTVTNATVSFGTIVTSGVDTVIIDASSGSASAVASTPAVTSVTSAGSSGAITVTSTVPNAIVDITYPASIVLDDGAAASMTVDQISTYSTPTPLTLDGSGSGTINVGGKLSIGAGQTAGTYSKTGTIGVNYQ